MTFYCGAVSALADDKCCKYQAQVKLHLGSSGAGVAAGSTFASASADDASVVVVVVVVVVTACWRFCLPIVVFVIAGYARQPGQILLISGDL